MQSAPSKQQLMNMLMQQHQQMQQMHLMQNPVAKMVMQRQKPKAQMMTHGGIGGFGLHPRMMGGELLGGELLGGRRKRLPKHYGAGFWQDFGTGFKKGFKATTGIIAKAAPIASLIAPEFAPELATIGAVAGATNQAMGGRRARLPKSGRKPIGHARNQARGAIVRQLMYERGMTLPQASHYIKANNIPY